MNLKIDSRQKIKYIRSFLAELKSNPSASPFMTINISECGFYDFEFITRRRKTIAQIDKDTKDNKYDSVRQVCQDLKSLYINFKEYLLLEDQLQSRINRLITEVVQFQARFAEDFKDNNRLKQSTKNASKKDDPASASGCFGKIGKEAQKQDQQPNSAINTSNNGKMSHSFNSNINSSLNNYMPDVHIPYVQYNRKSTFAQRLQFIFYLKSHQDNIEYIKSIGDSYSIGWENKNKDRDTSAVQIVKDYSNKDWKQAKQMSKQIKQKDKMRDQETSETGNGDYVIKLEANTACCLWLQLLAKKN